MVDVKKDLLEMFGLKEDFSKEELKQSYKRLVKIAHPDAGGDANLFKFITKCKELLLGDEIGFEFEEDKSKKNPKDNNPKNYKGNKKDKIYDIKFDILDAHYTACKLNELEEYNIENIYENIKVHFKNLIGINEKFVNLTLKTPYINFIGNNFVEFTSDVIIPKEFKNSKFLKVNVFLLNKMDSFIISGSNKTTKVIEYSKWELFSCLKLIINLNFKNEN